MAAGQKQENRGGYRPGSGRKLGSRQTLSVRQVDAMLKEAEKMAEEHGKSIHRILLEFIHNDDGSMRDRTACIKLWYDYTIAKLQEGGETDQALGPAVYLPEQKGRLKAIAGGKK